MPAAADEESEIRLHKVNYSDSRLTVSRSWKLRKLQSVLGSAESDGSDFTLQFRKDRLAYQAASTLQQKRLLWSVLAICDQVLAIAPTTRRVNRAALDVLAAEHGWASALESLGHSSLSGRPLESKREEDGEEEEALGMAKFMSAAEMEDVERMLSSDRYSELSTDKLEADLAARLEALECGSVESLLGWEAEAAALDGVLSQLLFVDQQLNDLQSTLGDYYDHLSGIHDALRQVEEENNRLEVQSRNNEALRAELAALVNGLDLGARTTSVLRDPAATLAAARFHHIERAGKKLADVMATRSSLGALAEMDAVKEQFALQDELRDSFTSACASFLEEQFQLVAEEEKAADLASGGLLPALPPSTALRERLTAFQGMLAVLVKLSPDLPSALRRPYADAFAKLYKQWLKAFFAANLAKVHTASQECRLSHLPDAEVDAITADLGPRHSLSPAAVFRHCLAEVTTLLMGEQSFLHRLLAVGEEEEEDDDDEDDDDRDDGDDDDDDDDEEERKEPAGGSGAAGGGRTSRSRRSGSSSSSGSSSGGSSPEEVAALRILFGGIVDNFKALVEAADRHDQISLLSMEMDVEVMVNKYRERSYFLLDVLTELQLLLKLRSNGFMQRQVDWISSLRADTKRAGILPPFRKFPTFVDLVEHKVRGRHTESAGTAYQKLVTSMFSWLEALSKTKPKYEDIVRVENYYFFALTAKARGVPALEQYQQRAEERFEECLQSYITWMVSRELPGPIEFVEEVTQLLASMKASDVKFHVTEDRLTSVMTTLSSGLGKAVKEIKNRLQKHLGKSQLEPVVWERLTVYIIDSYSSLQRLVTTCFNKELPYSVEEVTALLEV
eukprot:PLAT3346.6.p1 GENE.PLAT3346.6~~PLAT3346.6.p1  ORF type:complete len:845 (+),score=500.07 PLAT3346.6:266-2800(+)